MNALERKPDKTRKTYTREEVHAAIDRWLDREEAKGTTATILPKFSFNHGKVSKFVAPQGEERYL